MLINLIHIYPISFTIIFTRSILLRIKIIDIIAGDFFTQEKKH
jgi:hypothetical protein